MLNHPFPLRITLPTGVFLLGLTLVGFVVVSETQSINERNEVLIQQRAAALGELFAPLLAENLPTNSASVTAALGRLPAVPNLKLALICDANGRVLDSTPGAWRGRSLDAPAVAVATFAEARRTQKSHFAFDPARTDLWAVFPVQLRAETPTMWFITQSDVAAQKAPAIAALRERTLLLATLVVAACAGVWYYFDRTIARRANSLVAATRELAGGRFDTRVPATGRDEFAHLSAAINRMAGELQAREAGLQQSEASHRAILEAALDAVVVMDHRGVIVEFNAAGERIFGYTRAEAVGQPLADLMIPAEQRARHSAGLARHLAHADGSVIGRTIEATAIRKGGTEFPAELTIVRLKGVEPPVFTGFIRDLSQRKRADTLRDTLLSLEMRLSAARTPVEAGRVIFAAADQLWSWDSGSLEVCTWNDNLTRTLLNIDIVDHRRREVDIPQPLSAPSARCRRVMQQGAELVLRRPPLVPPEDAVMFGDTTRPSASLMTVPIRWQSRAVGMLAVQSYAFDAFTDDDLKTLQGLADQCGGTLERLRTTEELRLSEARLAEIYANMDDAVYVLGVSVTGEITYETFNPRCEQVTGLKSAAVCGRSPADVLPPENAAFLLPHYRECLESGRTVHYESDLTYEVGRHCWSTTLVPIRDEHGRIYRIAAISRDITTQKTAQDLIAGQRDLFEHIAAGQALPDTLAEICRYAEARTEGWLCSILVLDPNTRRLTHGAAPSLPAEYCRAIDGLAIGPDCGSCGTAAFRRQTVLVTDVATDPLWVDYRTLALSHGLRACWSTPVFGAIGEVLGTLALYSREPRQPTALHETTIRLATHAASIALQQARAAAALRGSEARFATAFRASPVVMIISTLETGELLEVNDAFLRAFEFEDRNEVLNRTSVELGLWPDPADRKRLREALLTTGKLALVEQSFRTRKGELRYSLSSAERIELQGRPCVITLVFDISDRKLAEQRLAEAEQARSRQLALLTATLDNLSEGVVVCELDGRLAYWNRAALELHGFSTLEECQRLLPEFADTFEFRLADGRVVPLAEWPLNRVLRGETVQVWEATLVHLRAGWKKHFAYTGTLARDAAGQPLLGVITMVDITARRDLEEQFRQAQKMEAIGQLAGGVAHDFNNILTAIIARSELASHEPNLPGPVAETLQEVRRLGLRAAGLTSQLLAFSRRSMMQPTRLNLSDVVSDDAKMIRRMVGEDIRLEIVLHSAPLPIQADAGMLAQVLLNLAVNARDAMPRGGRLTLETSLHVLSPDAARRHSNLPAGSYACLQVRDTGEGIAPEFLPRIFEPFFTTKPVGKGTGLGLATVFGIVRQHHGTISVDSQVGHGTTFEVLLPIDESAAPANESVAESRPPRGTETILLVEDEAAVRHVTGLILRQHGYQVLEAEHGPAALKLWTNHSRNIALLLTDLVMPEGISGRDLADRLQPESPQLKVIFMTGYSADMVNRGVDLKRGQNFVQKPFESAQLLTLIRHVLDSS